MYYGKRPLRGPLQEHERPEPHNKLPSRFEQMGNAERIERLNHNRIPSGQDFSIHKEPGLEEGRVSTDTENQHQPIHDSQRHKPALEVGTAGPDVDSARGENLSLIHI